MHWDFSHSGLFFPEKIPRGTHSKMKKIFLPEKIYNGKGISKLI
jgi:hypothetical protein